MLRTGANAGPFEKPTIEGAKGLVQPGNRYLQLEMGWSANGGRAKFDFLPDTYSGSWPRAGIKTLNGDFK